MVDMLTVELCFRRLVFMAHPSSIRDQYVIFCWLTCASSGDRGSRWRDDDPPGGLLLGWRRGCRGGIGLGAGSGRCRLRCLRLG